MRILTALITGTFGLAAASPASAQKPIPIRFVAPAAHTDSGVVANVYVIRVLSDGRVLLNDATLRRVLLFDSTLKHFKIVADTAGESPVSFGQTNGGLLPFTGDSTAFVDLASRALAIIDPHGSFVRSIAPPNVVDMAFLSGASYGVPGFDLRGRMYYRPTRMHLVPDNYLFDSNGPDTTFTPPDTSPVIRADFERRRTDTVAMMHTPPLKLRTFHLPDRTGVNMGLNPIVNPLPVTDEWAYLADGTVAIVRGIDYHVDWFFPDGTKKSTPRMPFDWRRLSDDDKQRLVDSTQRQLDSAYDAAARRDVADGITGRRQPHPIVVKANEVPDFYPAVKLASQMRADPSGNLWVLPTTSSQAVKGLLYDVVNRNGEIIERVQLPTGRVLSGFGPSGLVYMTVPSAFGWPRLERARILR
jgi:hypothetical protein